MATESLPSRSRTGPGAAALSGACLATALLGAPTARALPRQDDPAAPPPAEAPDHEALLRRVEQLERQLGAQDDGRVDLSGEELPYLETPPDAHPLSRPWYQNLDVSGFAAFAYLDTGDAGSHPDGGFLVKEATLFVDALAWEDTSLFLEARAVRLGKDDRLSPHTGELHAHFRELWRSPSGSSLGLKVGRVDLPFGEEYLWQDAPDNPLITQTAAYPYGLDEGVVVYGNVGGFGWVAALTDGSEERSVDDDPAKAVTVRAYGNPTDALYLSASGMLNGPARESAFEWGGSHVEPVGAGGGPSAAGVSPSETVEAALYQADAILSVGAAAQVGLTLGWATIDDEVDAFDRDVTWFAAQVRYDIDEQLFAVLRYSGIGTWDDDEGYHFDGKIIADGNEAFGYDTRSLTRLAAGLGWRPNPRTLLKLEVGSDDFEVIDASPLDPDEGDRLYFGLELTVSF